MGLLPTLGFSYQLQPSGPFSGYKLERQEYTIDQLSFIFPTSKPISGMTNRFLSLSPFHFFLAEFMTTGGNVQVIQRMGTLLIADFMTIR